ncbi:MAG: flagellar biosynthesis regulator FlaF [Rhodospirillaceae bacterium]|nr:flagellar biosynthesis regulator FlaF [Rhodospirillaceae bacterium]
MSGYSAYQKSQRVTMEPIQVEADVLGRITREIESLRGESGPELVKCLYRNVQLWNAFAADCLSPDNKLTDQLKASIVSLSIWVEKHTHLVSKGKATPDALIDVNRSVIAGLFQAQKAQGRGSPPPPPGASHEHHISSSA